MWYFFFCHKASRPYGKLFFNKTDVAAAFDPGNANLGKIVQMCIQTHVLLQVVCGDVVTPHHPKIAFTIAHDDIGLAFNQNPKPVGIGSQMRKEAVKQYQDDTPPIVAKNAAEPLIARESTEARITSKTASNGVV